MPVTAPGRSPPTDPARLRPSESDFFRSVPLREEGDPCQACSRGSCSDRRSSGYVEGCDAPNSALVGGALALDEGIVPSRRRAIPSAAVPPPRSTAPRRPEAILLVPVWCATRRSADALAPARASRARHELEDVHRLGVRADAQERARRVERDAEDARRVAPAAKLVHLVAVGDAEDADHGPLVARRREERPGAVEHHVRDGRLVRLDDVGHRERDGVEEEHVAGRVGRAARRGGRGRREGRGGGRERGRVREVAVLGRRRQGADGCVRACTGQAGGDGGGVKARRARLTLRVGARLDLVQQFHVANVVEVDALFEDDDEPSPVELDGEDRGGERQLADGRLPLRGGAASIRSAWRG